MSRRIIAAVAAAGLLGTGLVATSTVSAFGTEPFKAYAETTVWTIAEDVPITRPTIYPQTYFGTSWIAAADVACGKATWQQLDPVKVTSQAGADTLAHLKQVGLERESDLHQPGLTITAKGRVEKIVGAPCSTPSPSVTPSGEPPTSSPSATPSSTPSSTPTIEEPPSTSTPMPPSETPAGTPSTVAPSATPSNAPSSSEPPASEKPSPSSTPTIGKIRPGKPSKPHAPRCLAKTKAECSHQEKFPRLHPGPKPADSTPSRAHTSSRPTPPSVQPSQPTTELAQTGGSDNAFWFSLAGLILLASGTGLAAYARRGRGSHR